MFVVMVTVMFVFLHSVAVFGLFYRDEKRQFIVEDFEIGISNGRYNESQS